MDAKQFGYLDAINIVERMLGPVVARQADRQRSQCDKGCWTIASITGVELARIEHGGAVVTSDFTSETCTGTVSAIRVLCACGQPKVAIRDEMLARRFVCGQCKCLVLF